MKIGVFLDTGFYLGLRHPKDKYADVSEKILKSLAKGEHGLLYSSIFIICEATTLAAIRTKNNVKVLNFLEQLFWGDKKIATILPFSLGLEIEIWKLFKKVNTTYFKNEKPMSFIDVSSVVFCKQHQIEKIVRFDSHFDRFLTRISQ